MTTGLLFDPINPSPAMADTSLANWDRILPTLQEREIETFITICDYIAATGYHNVTGGELAAWCDRPIVSLRPRITGLVKKGWVGKCATRKSRADGELPSHPVRPLLPRSAIERARKAR